MLQYCYCTDSSIQGIYFEEFGTASGTQRGPARSTMRRSHAAFGVPMRRSAFSRSMASGATLKLTVLRDYTLQYAILVSLSVSSHHHTRHTEA